MPLRDTGSDIHYVYAQFHIANFLKICTEIWGRLVPSHERMENLDEDDVFAVVHRSPTTSMRYISSVTIVAQTQVWRILHHDGFYLYHLQCVYNLLPEYYVNRFQFCEWLQRRLHILCDFLFTDKAQFTRDDITNTRPYHSSGG